MPCAIIVGCAPVVAFTGPQSSRSTRTRWRSPAVLPDGRCASPAAKTVDLEIPADAEIVVEGLIDTELLEPEGPFGESPATSRSRTSTCRCA